MAEMVYYEKPVLLDRHKHRKLRVKPSNSYAFARGANSLFVAVGEFVEAIKEYPIVFTRSPNGKFVPLVMLGLRQRENLFVGDDNQWRATYVPAFVRRYPFVLAQITGQQGMGLCIDEAYAGFNETEGEALFDEKGENTKFLNGAMEFLTRFQQEFARTEQFCDRLDKAGLFKEMNAKADLSDGRSFTVSGLYVVDEQKLRALPDADVLSMFRSGELNLIALHMASLTNMQKLVAMVAQRPAPAAAEPAPPAQPPRVVHQKGKKG